MNPPSEINKFLTQNAMEVLHNLKNYETPVGLLWFLFNQKGSLASLVLKSHALKKNHFPARKVGNSKELMAILDEAIKEAVSKEQKFIGTEHLLYALAQKPSREIKSIFRNLHPPAAKKTKQPRNGLTSLKNHLREAFEGTTSFPALNSSPAESLPSLPPPPIAQNHNRKKKNQKTALNEFGEDLVKKYREKNLPPLVGREKELQKVMRTLIRRTKSNPLLIGDAGVGKSTLIYGLAREIASGKNLLGDNKKLIKNSLYSLDLGLLIAGTVFRGEFEARLKDTIKDAQKKNVILFIDEIHTLLGAGASQGSLDAANILKPALSSGEFQLIGATTTEDYRRYLEKDSALERRFQPIFIKEPTPEETLRILQSIKKRFEDHYNVSISLNTLKEITRISSFVKKRRLPDKAIDILDEACAYLKSKSQDKKKIKKPTLSSEDIQQIFEETYNFSPVRLAEINPKRLFSALKKEIIGQDNALRDLTIRTFYGLNKDFEKQGPLTSFLFLGPSGSGKTASAKLLSQTLKKPYLKLDMSEFSEAHTIARLLGAPAGYVGYEEGSQLLDFLRKNPESIIIFDEVDKAHPRITKILLQILDDGELTSADGEKIDFHNTLLILTSNIGGNDETDKEIGFYESKKRERESYIREAREFLGSELMGRIDQTILFNPLTKSKIQTLIKKYARQISLSLPSEKTASLAEKAYNSKEGARLVRKLVEEEKMKKDNFDI